MPDGDAWLTAAERLVLGGLRMPKRRSDWRLGRWVAKAAVLDALSRASVPTGGPAGVEILAAADGAPEATLLHAPDPEVAVSLSHSEGMGFAVAGPGVSPLGCDVEALAPRSDAFISDYLTPGERAWVLDADTSRRSLLANLLWSAKESALKALRVGLRADTRSVEVRVSVGRGAGRDRGGSLAVTRAGGDALRGWWRARGGYVWTVVSSGPFHIVEA